MSVLQEKSMQDVFKKQGKDMLEISSIHSSRFERSNKVELPPLSNRSEVSLKKSQSPSQILPHLMFITSDFTDINHLSEE